MRILINTINFAPELISIGKYIGEVAEWLADRGHDVRVVTADPGTALHDALDKGDCGANTPPATPKGASGWDAPGNTPRPISTSTRC